MPIICGSTDNIQRATRLVGIRRSPVDKPSIDVRDSSLADKRLLVFVLSWIDPLADFIPPLQTEVIPLECDAASLRCHGNQVNAINRAPPAGRTASREKGFLGNHKFRPRSIGRDQGRDIQIRDEVSINQLGTC